LDARIEEHLELIKENPDVADEDMVVMMEYLKNLNQLKREIALKLGNSVSRI
jgi:uncharacterized membrane protein YvbJ